MLLSGEHVTRPRRIEINAFASRIPALIPFPPIIFPFPTAFPSPFCRSLWMLHHPSARAQIYGGYLLVDGRENDGSVGMTKISWNLVGASHQLTCQCRRSEGG
ncbi:hypothetical protein ALC62_13574 [Cyphomyrmex costatus]|uniref:Uncharacterized protein n=1 Tax=Cyphomyrmex costatus TaxID=456900 RepID=A0A151I9K8_9HYME|nr:hypothetical protein ALC62_13574 [Cyphomyrmex costatus]